MKFGELTNGDEGKCRCDQRTRLHKKKLGKLGKIILINLDLNIIPRYKIGRKLW